MQQQKQQHNLVLCIWTFKVTRRQVANTLLISNKFRSERDHSTIQGWTFSIYYKLMMLYWGLRDENVSGALYTLLPCRIRTKCWWEFIFVSIGSSFIFQEVYVCLLTFICESRVHGMVCCLYYKRMALKDGLDQTSFRFIFIYDFVYIMMMATVRNILWYREILWC